MLHNPVVMPWRQRIWLNGLIQAMKHAWMVGRTVEKSQSLENGWMAIFCCWSSGLWAGLAQLKPPPRYWTATLVAPFNPAVFLSTQPSTLHRLTDSHLSKEKFPRHMTFYNTGNSFGSEFEHGRNPPPPPDGLKNLMFQNFNLAIFRFPPPSQDIGPLLPWPILPLPPRSPALKVGRGEGRICGSLQQWWG